MTIQVQSELTGPQPRVNGCSPAMSHRQYQKQHRLYAAWERVVMDLDRDVPAWIPLRKSRGGVKGPD